MPSPPRIGFLGPHATFTEQALHTLPESRDAELVPLPGAPAVLAGVDESVLQFAYQEIAS